MTMIHIWIESSNLEKKIARLQKISITRETLCQRYISSIICLNFKDFTLKKLDNKMTIELEIKPPVKREKVRY